MLDFLDEKHQYYIDNKASKEVIFQIKMAIWLRDHCDFNEFYDPAVTGDLRLYNDKVSNEEMLDTMYIHCAEMWYCLFMADFLFENNKINARLLEREIAKLDKFIKGTSELSEYEKLFLRNGKNDGSNPYAIEYLRLTDDYYLRHRLKRIGFFTSIAYVYGKYFLFYDVLNGMLSNFNKEPTVKQQALYYFYMSRSGAEKRNVKEYAKSLGPQAIKTFSNRYAEIKTKDGRRKPSNFNDLEIVRGRLKGNAKAIAALDEDLTRD